MEYNGMECMTSALTSISFYLLTIRSHNKNILLWCYWQHNNTPICFPRQPNRSIPHFSILDNQILPHLDVPNNQISINSFVPNNKIAYYFHFHFKIQHKQSPLDIGVPDNHIKLHVGVSSNILHSILVSLATKLQSISLSRTRFYFIIVSPTIKLQSFLMPLTPKLLFIWVSQTTKLHSIWVSQTLYNSSLKCNALTREEIQGNTVT